MIEIIDIRREILGGKSEIFSTGLDCTKKLSTFLLILEIDYFIMEKNYAAKVNRN